MRRVLLAGIGCLFLIGLTLRGCDTEVNQTVARTISSTVGGSVTGRGQEPFTYGAGMVVDLMAEA